LRYIYFALLITFFFPFASYASDKRLSLSGSSTIAPLISEIAKRFEKRYPEYRIDVQTGGSTRGIADAKRGLVNIGMSSRLLHEEEEHGVETHVLAMDGVAFVVHSSNAVKDLTVEQARKLYTGQIKNWKQVGGDDAAVTVIDRAKGRSELDLLSSFLGIKSREIVANLTCGENQQCLKLVAGNKNAITYMSVGTSEFEVKRGAPLRLLALEGREASVVTVKNGSYPIVRPLVLVTREDKSEEILNFLKYTLSPRVSDLVAGQAFVAIY
jgi:phosphate transport system substrate-binding protein